MQKVIVEQQCHELNTTENIKSSLCCFLSLFFSDVFFVIIKMPHDMFLPSFHHFVRKILEKVLFSPFPGENLKYKTEIELF